MCSFFKFNFLVFVFFISGSLYGDDRNEALNSVVMLTDEAGGFGSSIVVGEDESWIYIATAAHVVWDTKNGQVNKVAAEFKTYPDEYFPIILATPINRGAASSTPVSIDLDADFAVIKVNKENLPKIEMPQLSRISKNEEIHRVQFIGRKNVEQRWRGTPLFGVLDIKNLSNSESYQLHANTSFQLSGYSGGGVFDENWRLAGMTIKGGAQSKSFSEDKITTAIHIDWIIDKLISLSIPVAPYLGELQEGFLAPETAMLQMPYPMLNVMPNSPEYDAGKLKFSFRALRETINNITLHVFIKTRNGIWSRLAEENIDASYGPVGQSNEWLLSKNVTDIFVCYSVPLKEGGRGAATVSLSEIKLPLGGYDFLTIGSPGYKQTPPLYSTRSLPCGKIAEAEGVNVK